LALVVQLLAVQLGGFMAFRDLYHLEDLKNIAEDLVIDQLEKQLAEKQPDIEIDEDVILDMAAFALNMIKPMYRANLMGRVYAPAFEAMYHEEIEKVVAQAIEKVLGNPPSGA